MKFISTTILVLSYLVATCSFASDREMKKHFFILGGGGENPETSKEDTIFDKSFGNVVDYLNSSPNVSRDVRFDGEYNSLISINATLKNTNTKKATVANIKESINKIKNDIETGAMVEGDQLIIYIDSHGELQDKDAKESTHSVSVVPDYEAEENNDSAISQIEALGNGFSLDRLMPLIEIAKKKGIRLGIIDVSCYSGSLLKLADKNTCVITGASENLPSKNGFAMKLSKNLKAGRSMEDVFLRTRESLKNLEGNPQISGPAGEKAKEFLIGLENFLIDNTAEKLNENVNTECHYTTYTMPPVDNLLEDLKKVITFNLEEVGRMEEALANYNKYLEMMKEAFNLQLSQGKTTLKFGNLTYTWSELKNLNIEEQIKYNQEAIDGLTKKPETSNNLKIINALSKKNDELKTFIPEKKKIMESLEYKKYLSYVKDYEMYANYSWGLSQEVGASEKKLYLDIYKTFQTEEKSICSEIVF